MKNISILIYIPGSAQADIVLALHVSPRASQFDFAAIKDYLKKLVSGIDFDNTQLGLMIYAADPEIVFHINQ